MSDARQPADLSYQPPSDEEMQARAVQRSLEMMKGEESGGSGWFSPMSTTEKIMQGAMLGLGAVDWGQTINFTQNHPGKRELNPLLGSHPSRAKVNTLIPLGLALHTLGAYALPRPYRNILQGLGLGAELYAVGTNLKHGIGPVAPWR